MKYWTNLVLLSYTVILILCTTQTEFQMFYAFTVLTLILLVFINLDKFEPLSQEFKQKTEELDQLIRRNHSIALALSL
jgi:hypothetical protein